MGHPVNIIERINAAYYQFTAAERKVADFVLVNHNQVQFMSISQLADECGTAEASVSRFCRSLQLKGFNAFKIELARNHSVNQPSNLSPNSLAGRNQEIGRLANEAISQTLSLIDPEQILKTVELFENASRIMCIGSGGSMVIANECAHLFSTVSGKFYAVSDSHTQISAAATMTSNDVIVLFSYSGATTNGIQVLELAQQLNIPTVLVTRFSRSPAAKLASVVLCCGSTETPFQIGSVPAKIAQLIVMDVLFQEFRHRNQESCEDTVRRIAAALSNKHV